MLPHLLAEAGHLLVATASVASGVTSRGAGPVPPVVSTRSQRASSTSSRSVAAMVGLLVGDEPRLPVDRVAQRARQPVAQRRDALVLVDAGRGAVADRDQADAHRLVAQARSMRRFRHRPSFVLADELEQLAVGAAAALLGRAARRPCARCATSARSCCTSVPRMLAARSASSPSSSAISSARQRSAWCSASESCARPSLALGDRARGAARRRPCASACRSAASAGAAPSWLRMRR